MVFVMINASDNPKMVALLLFVQVVVPLLQSSAGSETSSALDVTALILLGLTFYLFWRIFVYLQTLRELHLQYPDLPWRDAMRAAYARFTAPAPPAAAEPNAQENAARSADRLNKIMRTIQVMPMEEYRTTADLKDATIGELRERLQRRDVDSSGCVERRELVDLLVEFRGGPSNNDTCCICCEEYQAGDLMRLLRKCKHEFHLECLDKWAFTSASSDRVPSCPLCNQQLE